MISPPSVNPFLSITISILYFNYHENAIRLETRKKSAILDHWGKGAPSGEEIAALEESLRREMEEMARQEAAEQGLLSPEQEEEEELEDTPGRLFNGMRIILALFWVIFWAI